MTSVGTLAVASDVASGHQALVALCLIIGATGVFWATVRAFGVDRPGIAFHGLIPAKLVVRGPYKYVRHPFYLAYLLFWIGVLVAAPNVVTAVPVLVMGIYYVCAARGEEKEILKSDLGGEYSEYSARTGMFLPRIDLLVRRAG